MTDLQSWVARDGKLIVNGSDAIDLSHMRDVTAVILKLLGTEKTPHEIRYMSLASCQLSQIPPIFLFQGPLRVKLSESLEYISFYGNNFGNFQTIGYKSSINATGATETISGLKHSNPRISWTNGLRNVTFNKLLQLDLRACRIETLDGFIFQGMPSLTHLYLGENKITFVEAHAFVGLRSITHLDLSRNIYVEEDNSSRPIVFESLETFLSLNLISLDFSYTPLGNRHAPMLSQLGIRLESLSLCNTAIFQLSSRTFSASPLKYLDVSGNPNIISDINVLRGLENSLRVLYAHSTMLKSLIFLRNFTKLEILKVANNDIVNFPRQMMHTLESLQVLDLARNRITSWFISIISTMPRLQLLSLKENNLYALSKNMIDDMSHVKYLSLSKNSMTCHCFSRDMYEIAFQNELKVNKTFLNGLNDTMLFHNAYMEYNDIISKRNNLTLPCLKMSDSEQKIGCLTGSAINITGDFLFLDYEVNDYSCFSIHSGKIIPQQEVPTCTHDLRDNRSPDDLRVARRSNLILLAILLIILPITAFIFIYRRNLKYFLITIRNSAMLSLMKEKDMADSETKIFNYDVFVSYCNKDRPWVLDHLLPHVEIDCNISVCLHERDFQVGLSILENIVSCMDRSRSIMLIISKRFLLSQWCQFEMHLAQHRLLETRREDLILILLEEIPRRLRPNTLHYLMLTKTYIVWPKEESESKEFWKRMKKSLVTQKLKSVDNDSLA